MVKVRMGDDCMPESRCPSRSSANPRLPPSIAKDFIRSHRNEPIEELKRSLCAAVEAFAGDVPQADDMTIVLARRNADEGFAQK